MEPDNDVVAITLLLGGPFLTVNPAPWPQESVIYPLISAPSWMPEVGGQTQSGNHRDKGSLTTSSVP